MLAEWSGQGCHKWPGIRNAVLQASVQTPQHCPETLSPSLVLVGVGKESGPLRDPLLQLLVSYGEARSGHAMRRPRVRRVGSARRPHDGRVCLAQGDAAKQSLSRQVLCADSALESALRWREDCTRFAVEQAGAWMCPPVQSDTPPASVSEAQLPTAAGSSALPQPMEEGGVAAGRGEAAEALAVASGHVEVCGVALPRREGGGGAGADARGGRGLIRTPAVEASLEAAALVLAQDRPLLLEGPPGTSLHGLLVASVFRLTMLLFSD